MSESKTNAIAGLAIIAFVLFCIIGLIGFKGCTASTGFRDGTVQKFSEKGILFDTFEGELAVKGIITRNEAGGAKVGNTFEFSVWDSNLAHTIENLPPDSDVRLRYRQHRWVWPTKGETAYEVTDIEVQNTKGN